MRRPPLKVRTTAERPAGAGSAEAGDDVVSFAGDRPPWRDAAVSPLAAGLAGAESWPRLTEVSASTREVSRPQAHGLVGVGGRSPLPAALGPLSPEAADLNGGVEVRASSWGDTLLPGAMGLVVTAMITAAALHFDKTSLTYGPAPAVVRVGLGLLFHGLAMMAVWAVWVPGAHTPRWLACWVGFAVAGTTAAFTGRLGLEALVLAGLVGGGTWTAARGIVSVRGMWPATALRPLLWAVAASGWGVAVVAGGSLSEAYRQAIAFSFAAVVILNPLTATLLGRLLWAMCNYSYGLLDLGKLMFFVGLLLLFGSFALGAGHRGPALHVGGMDLQLFVAARLALLVGLALYVGHHPEPRSTSARRRILIAFLVCAIGFACLRETTEILLLAAGGTLVGLAVWGLVPTLVSASSLTALFIFLAYAVKAYYPVPAERLALMLHPLSSLELSRVFAAIGTAGLTGLTGANLHAISRACTSDYAPAAITLNYGLAGLLLAVAMTALGTVFMVASAARLPNAPTRVLGLALTGFVVAQWIVPVLSLAQICPFGGTPFGLMGRGIAQLLGQAVAISCLSGLVTIGGRDHEQPTSDQPIASIH